MTTNTANLSNIRLSKTYLRSLDILVENGTITEDKRAELVADEVSRLELRASRLDSYDAPLERVVEEELERALEMARLDAEATKQGGGAREHIDHAWSRRWFTLAQMRRWIVELAATRNGLDGFDFLSVRDQTNRVGKALDALVRAGKAEMAYGPGERKGEVKTWAAFDADVEA